MKRSIVVGVVAFLIGAASAPRAANENETLSLLCKRLDEASSRAPGLEAWFKNNRNNGDQLEYRLRLTRNAAMRDALDVVRSAVCAK